MAKKNESEEVSIYLNFKRIGKGVLVLREEWVTGDHAGTLVELARTIPGSHLYIRYGDGDRFLVSVQELAEQLFAVTADILEKDVSRLLNKEEAKTGE